MDEELALKYWKDAGHVARRTLEAMKEKIVPGATLHETIEAAERYIHRHGGKPAFPGTIAVNDIAAHFTTDHNISPVEDWDGDMVLQKGDCVKIDYGVHIKGHIGDNALTIEVGNTNNHTEQIKAAKDLITEINFFVNDAAAAAVGCSITREGGIGDGEVAAIVEDAPAIVGCSIAR